jgi:transcriptional regulator with XRE-family HTH domain
MSPWKVIRRYRRAIEMSQRELGEKIGVCTSYISELESGVKDGSLALLNEACMVLKLKTWEVVKEAAENKH